MKNIIHAHLPLTSLSLTHLADKGFLSPVFGQMCCELCACLEAHFTGMAEVRQCVCMALKMYVKILLGVQLYLTVAAHQKAHKLTWDCLCILSVLNRYSYTFIVRLKVKPCVS